MNKLYYRGMAEQNGKPKIGRSARLLGVRPGIDIDIEQMPTGYLNEQGYLLAELEREFRGELVAVAVRNTKGMSVSISIESLPAFRRPTKFGGTGKDSLWQIDDIKIIGDLQAVQDSPTHVSILPRATMSLEMYEAALANTQNDWERVD
ncbi:MAG: hypothetical protein JGK24_30725 [Microcoleus sp. PH2017_29_MFU_D_A]|jgi:hypothetical protein|uniref:Tse2 family ADP-ribosyltransferase toxin n=1 Tax=unclassified Microcoleus TaxID=2642155 RepID=UPI001DF786B4|nr:MULTISPECIES: hypothetical protein [unclassified Microcoleus]MCC3420801.1 hypothetical protein [Microcoleus sp. PH2017_07_MST_O_A]MCC3430928.1 hypothetical protein [Microcoleus sp. PH2017_04_SCI_O_A]MCC3443460.1 hypothetical protein [Microcoleus sp. PH2017_03_ELD_O_A]MCC3505653.1 hypothetical protein [Microcoleus sp. PH2017_19_SFW_U_A]MCC3512753.1 hypothetical protein [Microcoleus sp. PH2017_17_BER_D_A]TAE07303.1 MAG: hypothetical protein EAZ94_29280 [Oscillatoriales cyanobacterium]